MINWIEVLRRIMNLYNVKTQQELGMALGVPVAIGMGDAPETTIPWPILELVVSEKKVSWDWLLAGVESKPAREAGKATAGKKSGGTAVRAPETGATTANAARARIPGMRPNIETRELERRLLAQDSYREPESPSDAAPDDAGEEAVIRELEEIRETMRREMDRVTKLLEECRKR